MIATCPNPDLPAWPAWVAAARRGDAEAYGRLVEHFWEGLVRLARGLLADDAEDVVQEALVHAWSRLRTLRDDAAFPAWLRRSVVRRCLRRQRREVLLAIAREGPKEPAAAVPPTDRLLDAVRLLAALPGRQRACLFLTEVEGMHDQAAAELLGMAVTTLRVHRWRARRRLRHLLGEEP